MSLYHKCQLCMYVFKCVYMYVNMHESICMCLCRYNMGHTFISLVYLYVVMYISSSYIHLYSTFRTKLQCQFSNVTSQLFFPPGHFAHCVIPYWGGATPPRSTPWGAYRPAISHKALPLYHSACWMWHSPTHSHMVDRSTVVGHVLMDHTCSFMCTSHIDMTTHHPAFLRVG